MQFQSGVVRHLCFVLFFALSTFGWGSPALADPKSYYVYKNEYLIEPLSNVAAASSGNELKSLGFDVVRELGTSGVKLIKPATLAAQAKVGTTDNVVLFDSNASACPELLKRGLAKSCSPNYQVKISATPNDRQLGDLWGMGEDGMNAKSAWDVSTGSSSVVAAVIDTGADYTHQDLAANIWTNPDEIPGNGIDDDHNGYIDDVHGINASTNTGDPMDDNSHGTHVSGTIGAIGNNSIGVVGVNWQVKIMALKFLDKNGSGSLSDAITAINYMVLMKNRGINIRVANNSWGGGGYSAALESAIAHARDAGIIFAAAAGNESNDNDSSPSYPAGYEVENVVSVAAIDVNQNLASFSNYGATTVGIAAPGVNILSTIPGNRYAYYSGTSMATPHITGALALLFASEPALTYSQAITRLYESGSDLGSLNGVVRTSRKANVARMLRSQTLPVPATPEPSVCQYSMEEISYAPDNSADAAPIVIQADEGSFYTLALPFQFPFHGTLVNTLYLSPNGVVYTKSAPVALDYNNQPSAPHNAIAALHADLTANADPYGVRVATSADHVTILWKVKHFSMPSGGDVEARLTIYADGHIEDFLVFSDHDVQTALQQASTVGLTGPTSASAVTYAYNSAMVKSGSGVRFTPYCSSSAPQELLVHSVKVYGVSSARLKRSVASGKRLQIDVSGTGSGTAEVRAAFDRRTCPSPIYTAITAGSATIHGTLPKISPIFKKLTISVGQAKGTVRIAAVLQSRLKKPTQVSNSRLSRYCSALMQSLGQ